MNLTTELAIFIASRLRTSSVEAQDLAAETLVLWEDYFESRDALYDARAERSDPNEGCESGAGR